MSSTEATLGSQIRKREPNTGSIVRDKPRSHFRSPTWRPSCTKLLMHETTDKNDVGFAPLVLAGFVNHQLQYLFSKFLDNAISLARTLPSPSRTTNKSEKSSQACWDLPVFSFLSRTLTPHVWLACALINAHKQLGFFLFFFFFFSELLSCYCCCDWFSFYSHSWQDGWSDTVTPTWMKSAVFIRLALNSMTCSYLRPCYQRFNGGHEYKQ